MARGRGSPRPATDSKCGDPTQPEQERPTFSLPDTFFAVGNSSISPPGLSALDSVAADIEARYPASPSRARAAQTAPAARTPAVLAEDQTLSAARADAVCAALVAEGIPQGQTHSVGLGQTTAVPDAAARSVRIVIGAVGS